MGKVFGGHTQSILLLVFSIIRSWLLQYMVRMHVSNVGRLSVTTQRQIVTKKKGTQSLLLPMSA